MAFSQDRIKSLLAEIRHQIAQTNPPLVAFAFGLRVSNIQPLITRTQAQIREIETLLAKEKNCELKTITEKELAFLERIVRKLQDITTKQTG